MNKKLRELVIMSAMLGGFAEPYSVLDNQPSNEERLPKKVFDEDDKERLAKAQEKRARRYAKRKELLWIKN